MKHKTRTETYLGNSWCGDQLLIDALCLLELGLEFLGLCVCSEGRKEGVVRKACLALATSIRFFTSQMSAVHAHETQAKHTDISAFSVAQSHERVHTQTQAKTHKHNSLSTEPNRMANSSTFCASSEKSTVDHTHALSLPACSCSLTPGMTALCVCVWIETQIR